MKKVTIQQIADTLGVSRITVWKAMNNKSGVSLKMKQLILEELQKQNYQSKLERISDVEGANGMIDIALVVERANTSTFWTRIISEIANYYQKYRINVVYMNIEPDKNDSYVFPAFLRSDRVKGMIVINVYERGLIEELAELPIPKVFLDMVAGMPFDRLNGDLVLLEGLECVREVTEHIAGHNCKRIGFIGDIHYAETNRLRWLGYRAGLRKNSLTVDAGICKTSFVDKYNHREEVLTFLDSLASMPDAFICVNDFTACIVLQYLFQRKMEKRTMVSGYDNNAYEFMLYEYEFSTVHVRSEQIGTRLANQLLYKMQNPDGDHEMIYIKPKLLLK